MIKKYIKISLASPRKILKWSERSLPNRKLIGKVTKPERKETIDHRTFKPIVDGLFCEKIFGPTKDYECSCKLYKKLRIQKKEKNQILICPNCNVEIGESKIRKYRMGLSPIVHLWYLKNIPNYIANKNKLHINQKKLINYFTQTKNKLEWMTLIYLPVLPPNLRPILKLQDGTIVTADINFLYSKILNSNNRIEKLKKMQVSEIFLRNEKCLLQESEELQHLRKKPLKSISSTIKGKHGRLRENLLGKTVDYSARSVIVVEPKLKLHQFLLNRAPTLHRVGIQSFIPKLTSKKSIKLHPLVCSAFNADFDGDQMGIHIPLSLKSQSEARILMLSANNCTSIATGKASIVPSQDMVLGCYYLTSENTSIFYLTKPIE
uniref:RNA polymerase subunit beta' n=1 Tax=Flexiglena variabilis TaxID=2743688 RepID=UPI0023AAFA00|nr:RNA polymerase subunit beta' [Flexiglena variabilis]WCH63513.1 RNA polymerase subunit beta' [Flexiglena variabilis]